MSSSRERPKGLHLDPWLVPASPGLKELAATTFDTLEREYERPVRQWLDALHRRRLMVENIVANMALLVAYHPAGLPLAVSAKNKARSRYDRADFHPKAFMRLVREMEGLGMLSRTIGAKGVSNTLLRPQGSLLGGLRALPNPPGLDRLEGAESVILKAYAGRRRPKVQVEYEDTPETVLARKQMATINDALNSASITFGGKAVPPIFLRRHFQITSTDAPRTFDQHGRLYDGFWENLRKEDRHLIQIDGQQVAEIDFSGMFVQLAYAEAGLDPPEGDPYGGLGLPRKAAKIAFSALLSKTGPIRQLPDDLAGALDRPMTGRQITNAVLQKHEPIAHLFGKRVGLSLMFTESQILIATLLRLIEQGRIALPLHDGLLVTDKDAEACEAAMTSASREVLGRPLPVSRKPTLKRPPSGVVCPSRCESIQRYSKPGEGGLDHHLLHRH